MPGTFIPYNSAYYSEQLIPPIPYALFVTSSYSTTAGSTEDLYIAPTNVENQSQTFSTNWTLYTITAINTWKSIEIFNNGSTNIYVDFSESGHGPLTTVYDLTSYGMIIRGSTYYSISKLIEPGDLRIVTTSPNQEVRIIGYY